MKLLLPPSPPSQNCSPYLLPPKTQPHKLHSSFIIKLLLSLSPSSSANQTQSHNHLLHAPEPDLLLSHHHFPATQPPSTKKQSTTAPSPNPACSTASRALDVDGGGGAHKKWQCVSGAAAHGSSRGAAVEEQNREITVKGKRC